MSIGDNLRTLRLNSGMTQEQVAEKLGVTRQTLSSYESERTRPDIDMLTRLCEVYGTDLDGIVYGQNRMLRAMQKIRMTARILLVVLPLLTVLSSMSLWSANRFFPVTGGHMTQELKEIFAYHSRLVSTWETMDGIILTVTLIGFIVLLSLLLSSKCVVTLRQRMVYLAILAGSVFLAALPFAFTDGIFAPVNYLITPAMVVGRTLFFFVLHFVIEVIQKRKAPAPRQD